LASIIQHKNCKIPTFTGGGVSLTLKFELGLDFLTMHLAIKFHHPTFNHSQVMVLTNKQQILKQILLKTPTTLHYATPVEI